MQQELSASPSCLLQVTARIAVGRRVAAGKNASSPGPQFAGELGARLGLFRPSGWRARREQELEMIDYE